MQLAQQLASRDQNVPMHVQAGRCCRLAGYEKARRIGSDGNDHKLGDDHAGKNFVRRERAGNEAEEDGKKVAASTSALPAGNSSVFR